MVNIILNGESPLRLGTSNDTQFPAATPTVLKALPRENSPEKEMKGAQITKEKIELSLFTDGMTLYVNMLTNPPKTIVT
jgi:hypothetical protein